MPRVNPMQIVRYFVECKWIVLQKICKFEIYFGINRLKNTTLRNRDTELNGFCENCCSFTHMVSFEIYQIIVKLIWWRGFTLKDRLNPHQSQCLFSSPDGWDVPHDLQWVVPIEEVTTGDWTNCVGKQCACEDSATFWWWHCRFIPTPIRWTLMPKNSSIRLWLVLNGTPLICTNGPN